MRYTSFFQKATLVSLLTTAVVRAGTIQPRYSAGCALLETTVYCYGGQNGPTLTNFSILQDNLFNSFSVESDMALGDMQSSWTSIQREHLGPLYYFAMLPMADQKTILVDGGGVKDTSVSRPKYALYDLTSQDWATDLFQGHPSVSHHTAIRATDDTIYIWGGVQYPDDYIAKNLSITHPMEMFLFNANKKRWVQSNSPSFLQSSRARHAAVLGEDGITIYYIGGVIPYGPADAAGTTYHYTRAPMDQIITFNTDVLTWDTWNTTVRNNCICVGEKILVFNSRADPATYEILLIGGYDSFENAHRKDSYYALNTKIREWRPITIGMDDGVSEAPESIFGHSAVAVGKYLFVIFGSVPPVGAPTSDIRAINMETMTWTASFTAPLPSSSPSTDDDTSSNTGTIVGAAVGAVGGVALVAGLLAFCIIRKRRQKRAAEEKETNSSEKDYIFSPPSDHKASPSKEGKEYSSEFQPPVASAWEQQSLTAQSHSIAEAPHSYDSSSEGTQQKLSNFYGTEKPDGGNSSARRIVLTPVKPDGA